MTKAITAPVTARPGMLERHHGTRLARKLAAGTQAKTTAAWLSRRSIRCREASGTLLRERRRRIRVATP
jgi:hypothetical protein